MVNNPIGDTLIRLKNASLARHPSLRVPYSGLKERVVRLLVKSGYLIKADVVEEGGRKFLQIELKYKDKQPMVASVRQISKPGLRRYFKVKDLARFRKRGNGLVILSTPSGIMSLEEAKKQNLGGEILGEVW